MSSACLWRVQGNSWVWVGFSLHLALSSLSYYILIRRDIAVFLGGGKRILFCFVGDLIVFSSLVLDFCLIFSFFLPIGSGLGEVFFVCPIFQFRVLSD